MLVYMPALHLKLLRLQIHLKIKSLTSSAFNTREQRFKCSKKLSVVVLRDHKKKTNQQEHRVVCSSGYGYISDKFLTDFWSGHQKSWWSSVNYDQKIFATNRNVHYKRRKPKRSFNFSKRRHHHDFDRWCGQSPLRCVRPRANWSWSYNAAK